MRFSVWPINQQPLTDVLAVCAHAEATGWDGAWVADHLMPASAPQDVPVVECWTTVTAIAATVPRLTIGTLVLSNTFRHPGVLAKMAATLTSWIGDRLVLGLGAGWQRNEHDAYGLELPPPGERLRRLDEACRVVRRLLDDGGGTFEGGRYTLRDAVSSPAPTTRVPLLLGVKGDRALLLAAEHADVWNLWATPEVLRERTSVLERHCEALGRDPATIARSAQALMWFSDDAPSDPRWQRPGPPLLVGSVGELCDQVGAYRDAGLDELIVPDFALRSGAAGREALDRFLSEVASPFR